MQHIELPSEPEELRFHFEQALDAYRRTPTDKTLARTLALVGLRLAEQLWDLRKERTPLQEILLTTLSCLEPLADAPLFDRWATICARVLPIGIELHEGTVVLTRSMNAPPSKPNAELALYLLALARLAHAKGEDDLALALGNEALKRKASDPSLLWFLALLAEETRDHDTAMRHLRGVLLCPLPPDLPFNKALVYTKIAANLLALRDPIKASSMLERALQLDPNLVVAKELLAQCEKK